MKTERSRKKLLRIKGKIPRLSCGLAVAGVFIAALGLTLQPAARLTERTETAVLARSRKAVHASVIDNLANSKTGRVVLHTLCLVRHPDRASWHWHGILRELAA